MPRAPEAIAGYVKELTRCWGNTGMLDATHDVLYLVHG